MATAAAAPAATILVVEDEETLRFTLSHNLKREGYTVLTAARGDDALALAREPGRRRVRRGLLDLMLPGSTACEVCRRCARRPIPDHAGDRARRRTTRSRAWTGRRRLRREAVLARELLARVRALLRRSTAIPKPHEGANVVISAAPGHGRDRREA